jgi:hypothetical protein
MAELIEGNDRSAIITITAICDAALEARIGFALPGLKTATEKKWEDAFRHDGALGTLSAKIGLAFYMGLIDERTQKQLTDLRHIRNAVAHTKRRVSFEDAALQNAATRLLAPYGMYPLLNETPEGFRRSIVSEGMLLFAIIHDGRDTAVAKTREAFTSIGRPSPF